MLQCRGFIAVLAAVPLATVGCSSQAEFASAAAPGAKERSSEVATPNPPPPTTQEERASGFPPVASVPLPGESPTTPDSLDAEPAATSQPTAAPSPSPTPSPTEAPTATPTPSPTPTEITHAPDVFSITLESALQSKIDLVWVIDNSGSMGEEAAKVNANFARFITGLSGRVDLKVALISSDAMGTTAVKMPAEALKAGHVQVSVDVESNDALLMAAIASCPASETSYAQAGKPARICNTNGLTPYDRAYAVRGTLASFFRPATPRIYVIVSDDNATIVTDANFLSLVSHTTDGRNPTVFAFRGIASRSGCSIAQPGLAYANLAAMTGGETYDICTPDWSPYFDKLSHSVEMIAKTTFDLSAPDLPIVSVTVDGAPLAAGHYHVDGRRLIVDPGTISNEAKEIVVHYGSR